MIRRSAFRAFRSDGDYPQHALRGLLEALSLGKASPLQRLSPIWIESLFLSVTVVVLGFAVINTAGWVQGLLASFMVVFGLGVAAAFLYVLWHRPNHFDYAADNGANEFIATVKGGPKDTLDAIATIARDPTNHPALYQLLDNTLDATTKQQLILLDKGAQLPFVMPSNLRYEFGTRQQDWTSGMFDGRKFLKGLNGTGLIELATTGAAPSRIQITEAGRAFADWLVQEGKMAEYFDCDLG